jgi:hypothetical protein
MYTDKLKIKQLNREEWEREMVEKRYEMMKKAIEIGGPALLVLLGVLIKKSIR